MMHLQAIAVLDGSSASEYQGLKMWVLGAEVEGRWLFWRLAEGDGPAVTPESLASLPPHTDGRFRQLTPPSQDLAEAVGPDWVWFVPGYINPAFIPWFRERFAETAPAAGADLGFDRLLRATWERRLDLLPPR